MSNCGEPRRYSNPSTISNSNSREKFRNDPRNPNATPLGNTSNQIEEVRPLGLIKKYPNYEPFHPPPQENFEYPQYMHPPQKRRPSSPRGGEYERNDRLRRRSNSGSDRDSRDHSYGDRNGHHRSEHRNRSGSSGRRRDSDRDKGRHGDSDRDRRGRYGDSDRDRDRRRSRSGSREERRRSKSYNSRDRKRSTSRERGTHRRRHDSPNSNSSDGRGGARSRRSESREDISTDVSVDDKPSNDYWVKTESADDSEADLETELHPLSHHLYERKRLLKEALRSLKGKRLGAMIPPLIKEMKHGELERSCLNILEGVSNETVLGILNGKLAGFFDKPGKAGSADEEEENEEGCAKLSKVLEEQVPTSTHKEGSGGKKKKKHKKAKKKKEVEVETTDDKEETETEATTKKKSPKKVAKEEGKDKKSKSMKKKSKSSLVEPDAPDDSSPKKSSKELKVKKKKEKKEKSKKKKGKGHSEKVSGGNESGGPAGGHKSLMELLELEFRAKAIKALLRTQGVVGIDVDEALAPEPQPPQLPPHSNNMTKSQQTQLESPVSPVKVMKNTKKPIPTATATDAIQSKPPNLPFHSHSTLKRQQIQLESPVSPVKVMKNTKKPVPTATATDAIQSKPPNLPFHSHSTLKRQQIQAEYLAPLGQVTKKTRKPIPIVTATDIIVESGGGIVEEEDILELHAKDSSASEAEEDSNSDLELSERDESCLELQQEDEEREEHFNQLSDAEAEPEDLEDEENVEASEAILDPVSEAVGAESSSEDTKQYEGENELELDLDLDERNLTTDLLGSMESNVGNESSAEEPIEEEQEEEVEEYEDEELEEVVEEIEEIEEEIIEEPEEGEIRSEDEVEHAVSTHSVDQSAQKHESNPSQHSPPPLPPAQKDREVDADLESRASQTSTSARSWRNERNSHSDNSDDSDTKYSSYRRRRKINQKTEHSWESDGLEKVEDPKDPQEKAPQSPVEYISNFDTEPISDNSSPEHSDQDPSSTNKKTKISLKITSSPVVAEPLGVVLGCAEQTEQKNSSKDVDVLLVSNEISEGAEVVGADGDEDLVEEEPKPITWYERWFKSKSMQKVVQTNKIQKNLKSKLKSKKPKKTPVGKQPPNLDKNAEIESEPIIGSIEEYEKLFGKKAPPKNEEKNPLEDGDPNTVSVALTTEGKSDRNLAIEETEEDADLWGDILGDDEDDEVA